MGSLAQLFDGTTFQTTVRSYCSQQQWAVDLNDRRAILRFTLESGRNQTCYIIRYDTTLEFSVPSGFAFDNVNEVPHFFSTMLLKRSREKKVGFWCIEEIGDKQVYSCMHNAEMQLIDSKYFAMVVRALINECDEFEQYVSDS
jgi:hypothetical protein